MSKIKSYRSRSGRRTTHFDEYGNKIGETYVTGRGRLATHYDANGNKTGTSKISRSGHMTHYDNNRNKTGESHAYHSGYVRHYDTHHNKISESRRNFWGTYETEQPDKPNYTPSHHSVAGSNIGCATMLLLFVIGVLLLCILI